MKKYLLALALLLFPQLAAAAGIIYVDTAGSATNSGSTDSNTPTISGTAATWTTGANPITLDTNTNIATVAGCAAGTCDGSQSIFLTNATNANAKSFWLTGYTGCTGSGACTVNVQSTAPVALPTCTTCTAQAWSIGGRYLFPAAAGVETISRTVRPGDTIQFNNSPASRTLVFLTFANAGDATGRINIIGKAGQSVTLTVTGNNSIINGNSIAGYFIGNLTMSASGGTTNAVIGNLAGSIVDHVKITATTSANGIQTAGSNIIQFNEITGTGGDAIIAPNNVLISNNYVHDTVGGACISSALANPQLQIWGNVLVNCFTRGIYLSGASSQQQHQTTIARNTIYNNNTSAAFEIANANTVVNMNDNIIMNAGSGNAVLWAAGNAQLVAQHSYNVFYSAGGTALSGLTANSTEVVGNPLFVSPGTSNFAIQPTSPAAGAGYLGTLPGGTTTGFLDIGAVQRTASSGGGGHPCVGC